MVNWTFIDFSIITDQVDPMIAPAVEGFLYILMILLALYLIPKLFNLFLD